MCKNGCLVRLTVMCKSLDGPGPTYHCSSTTMVVRRAVLFYPGVGNSTSKILPRIVIKLRTMSFLHGSFYMVVTGMVS